MAVSIDTPSPGNFNKNALFYFDSSPSVTPASDNHIWRELRSRVQNRRLGMDLSIGETVVDKGVKEDSTLLLKGFDSIANTLSQFSTHLENAIQGARDLAKPPTLTETFPETFCKKLVNRVSKEDESEEDNERSKRNLKRKPEHFDSRGSCDVQVQHGGLKKAKQLAVSMASKASSVAIELKSIKSDLCFMEDRCALLEEENRKLREGFEKGIKPEEDDLIRLQLEALLSEKSRLANENANLTRENHCLQQLVEYHQLASQQGLCPYYETYSSDFSPMERATTEDNDECNTETSKTPAAYILGLSNSNDE